MRNVKVLLLKFAFLEDFIAALIVDNLCIDMALL